MRATLNLRRYIEAELIVLVFFIVICNTIDSFATLRHVGRGAIEVNPFMGALIVFDQTVFVIVKHLLVSVGLFGFVLFDARTIMRCMAALYGGLAVWQLYLFMVIS